MVPRLQVILFSAALWVPLACPAMAMEPFSLEGGTHVRVSAHQSVEGHVHRGDASALMDLNAPAPECCLGSAGQGMDHERGPGIIPQAGTYDAVPAVTVCERIDLFNCTEFVLHDASAPPPTFEERSVMKRE